jgi:2-alkyl-3-oxoalkanoate reductase
MTSRIFLAGATGVIGRKVVPLLLTAGHEVTGLARTPAKAAQLTAAGAAPALVQLFDPVTLPAVVAGHDVVINLATHIPTMARAGLPGVMRENNRIRTEGSANLARAARLAGAQRYVQESLTFLYADGGDTWLNEDADRDVPAGFASNDAAESQAVGFTGDGRSGVVLRFALFHDADNHLTHSTVRLARRGILATPGDPDAFLSTIHVDDAARAVVASIDAPAGVYNVVDDEPLRRRDYAASLAAAVGRTRLRWALGRILRAGGARIEVLARSQRVSNRLLREVTSWTPAYPSMRAAWPAIVRQMDVGS